MGSKVCDCVCGLCMVCGGVHGATGAQRRFWAASVTKFSKVYRSGPVRSVCKDRSHRSLKPVLLCFLEILLNLRKPPKPSFRPPFKTLDPLLAQKVIIFHARRDRSSVRSGSQRNIHPTASGSLAWDYGALHLIQHRPPLHYVPRQRKWRKAEKDPSYGAAPAFFVRYCIVQLEWWTNGTTLENLHAHVHLKGKLAPFAFHSRCTSAHSAKPSLACVSP